MSRRSAAEPRGVTVTSVDPLISDDPLTTVHPWSDRTAAVPAADDHSVLDRWDRVVAAHADAPALAGNGRSYTFGEADRAARGLATVLATTLRPDDHSGAGVGAVAGGASKPVGIMAGQTSEAVVAVLALVRAGRTVVVLDDHLPTARLEHVARLAGVDEILADGERAALAADVVAERAGSVHGLGTCWRAVRWRRTARHPRSAPGDGTRSRSSSPPDRPACRRASC